MGWAYGATWGGPTKQTPVLDRLSVESPQLHPKPATLTLTLTLALLDIHQVALEDALAGGRERGPVAE